MRRPSLPGYLVVVTPTGDRCSDVGRPIRSLPYTEGPYRYLRSARRQARRIRDYGAALDLPDETVEVID